MPPKKPAAKTLKTFGPHNAPQFSSTHQPGRGAKTVPPKKPSIGPNTTAPAKARSITLGPNKSFPAGDAKHARLAAQMAPKSYNAGNISKATETSIQSKARAILKKENG